MEITVKKEVQGRGPCPQASNPPRLRGVSSAFVSPSPPAQAQPETRKATFSGCALERWKHITGMDARLFDVRLC